MPSPPTSSTLYIPIIIIISGYLLYIKKRENKKTRQWRQETGRKSQKTASTQSSFFKKSTLPFSPTTLPIHVSSQKTQSQHESVYK